MERLRQRDTTNDVATMETDQLRAPSSSAESEIKLLSDNILKRKSQLDEGHEGRFFGGGCSFCDNILKCFSKVLRQQVHKSLRVLSV